MKYLFNIIFLICFSLIVKAQTHLPVELVRFEGTFGSDSNYVYLSWETATEVNNYGFDVQRYQSGNEWLTLGFVFGHGNSNSPKFYNFSDTTLVDPGEYLYRLKQIDTDGATKFSDTVAVYADISTLVAEENKLPRDFRLYQNYPNPFNSSTTISYSIPYQSDVKLFVYNINGEMIFSEGYFNLTPGDYQIIFDADNLSSEVYFYMLLTDFGSAVKKFVLLR